MVLSAEGEATYSQIEGRVKGSDTDGKMRPIRSENLVRIHLAPRDPIFDSKTLQQFARQTLAGLRPNQHVPSRIVDGGFTTPLFTYEDPLPTPDKKGFLKVDVFPNSKTADKAAELRAIWLRDFHSQDLEHLRRESAKLIVRGFFYNDQEMWKLMNGTVQDVWLDRIKRGDKDPFHSGLRQAVGRIFLASFIGRPL